MNQQIKVYQLVRQNLEERKLLNNQMNNLMYRSGNVAVEGRGVSLGNRFKPGKKPMSTMAPVMVFDKNNELTLITGSLWGKPMWGTWWVWDARLTSMLILFFFYLGFILLHNAFERKIDGSKSASVLAIIGLINLPIIKFSVDWWHTLHQPSSILKFDGPSIDNQMLIPLSFMIIGFGLFSLYLIIINVKTKLIEKKCEALILKLNLKEIL